MHELPTSSHACRRSTPARRSRGGGARLACCDRFRRERDDLVLALTVHRSCALPGAMPRTQACERVREQPAAAQKRRRWAGVREEAEVEVGRVLLPRSQRLARASVSTARREAREEAEVEVGRVLLPRSQRLARASVSTARREALEELSSAADCCSSETAAFRAPPRARLELAGWRSSRAWRLGRVSRYRSSNERMSEPNIQLFVREERCGSREMRTRGGQEGRQGRSACSA